MKVMIVGANGQVGRALTRSAPPDVELALAHRTELDITDAAAVRARVAAFKPKAIINAAAYTAVDQAETNLVEAMRVNRDGPLYLAEAAAMQPDCRLIHISTDFVFDGLKSSPYLPGDTPAPINAYGRSKLAGERSILKALPGRTVILRTSWVYAADGRNFLRSMLRLMERGAVRVVSDQIGTPTAASSVAAALWSAVAKPEVSGTYHWTDAGVASWYDFAIAIAEEGLAAGLLASAVAVTPIASSEYPTPASRPGFSVLDTSSARSVLGISPVHWRSRLRETLREIVIA